MFEISYGVAFLGGLVSFFASCVLPLLPVYIAYVTGTSLKELQTAKKISSRKVFLSSFFYVLGFSTVFTLLGGAISVIGKLATLNSLLIQQIAGGVIIIFGLDLVGVLNFGFFQKDVRLFDPKPKMKRSYFRSFVLGIIFATTWTPCVGPVLGSILALSAASQTAIKGALLLFIFSLGISLPFLIVSLTLSRASRYLDFIKKRINLFTKVSGVLLIALGLLLITDTYKYLNAWLLNL